MRPQIAVTATARGIEVASPYGSAITDALKAAGARWDAGARVWVVPPESAEPVRTSLKEQYGSVDSADTVLVELRPLAEISAPRVHWGPWWIASGTSYGSPIVSGIIVVAGVAKSSNRGSKRSPTYHAVLAPDTALRLAVPRDWFDARSPETDAGWVVREIAPVAIVAPEIPTHAPQAGIPMVSGDALGAATTDALLREVRTRVAHAMDAQRRVPGAESAAQLDRLGTLLAAIEGVL